MCCIRYFHIIFVDVSLIYMNYLYDGYHQCHQEGKHDLGHGGYEGELSKSRSYVDQGREDRRSEVLEGGRHCIL